MRHRHEVASDYGDYAPRGTISPVEVIALILAVLSLLVAIVGTALSNKRSSEALKESRKAAVAALWSGVQKTVQRFIGFDPYFDPIGDRLANFRIAVIALVDELEDWDGFDNWLEAERVLGAALRRQVMAQSKPGDTVDQRLNVIDPLLRWAHTLGGNLRLFRRRGYDADTVAKLRDSANNNVLAIYKAHDWELPRTTIPGVEALDS